MLALAVMVVLAELLGDRLDVEAGTVGGEVTSMIAGKTRSSSQRGTPSYTEQMVAELAAVVVVRKDNTVDLADMAGKEAALAAVALESLGPKGVRQIRSSRQVTQRAALHPARRSTVGSRTACVSDARAGGFFLHSQDDGTPPVFCGCAPFSRICT